MGRRQHSGRHQELPEDSKTRMLTHLMSDTNSPLCFFFRKS